MGKVILYSQKFSRPKLPRSQLKLMATDHHPRAFSIWMAGGRNQTGNQLWPNLLVENPVHVNDFHATFMHQMGN